MQNPKSELRAKIRAQLEKISPAVRMALSPFANGNSFV